MRYFYKSNGEIMTNAERRERYSDGRCALCYCHKWTTFYSPEERTTFAACKQCKTVYPMDKDLLKVCRIE